MTRGPGTRAGLTRGAVLDAARTQIAETGLSGLTMRALARRLGVAPNALYSHVPGKDELVDALLDEHLATVHDPSRDAAEPIAAVVALMTSAFDVLLGAPDLVPLYLARRGARGTHAVRLGETMDALLARAGVAPAAVPGARRTLIVHTIGSAAFADDDEPSRAAFDQGLRWLLAGIVSSSPPA